MWCQGNTTHSSGNMKPSKAVHSKCLWNLVLNLLPGMENLASVKEFHVIHEGNLKPGYDNVAACQSLKGVFHFNCGCGKSLYFLCYGPLGFFSVKVLSISCVKCMKMQLSHCWRAHGVQVGETCSTTHGDFQIFTWKWGPGPMYDLLHLYMH